MTNKTLVYSSIVCFLAWVFSVYDYTLFGTLLPPIAEDLGWSTSYATFIVTLINVGIFFVALSVGPLLDRFGRKPSLVITTVGAALSSGLTALAPGAFAAAYMTVVRTFSGLGYAEQAVNATYLNEMYGNRRNRGFIYSLVQGGWPIGVLLGAALTAVLFSSGLIGWRGMFIVATFPAIVISILALKLRESPKWQAMRAARTLETQGRREEAVEFAREYDIDLSHSEESTFKQLFEPDIRRHTIFISLAMFMNWIGIQVFAVLGTTIITEGKGVAFTNAVLVLIVSNAASYIGYLCHGFVGDRIGRRLTIAGGWLISGVAYTLMLFGPDSQAFVFTMYTVGLFFIIGPYAALLFFMGESFPTRVRGTGASLVNAMGPLGAIAGSGLLSLFTGAGLGVVTAAFLSGGLATIASGFLMFGTRDVKDPHQAEVVSQDSTAARVR
ncbi:MFS transporter [Rubrobacter marinus]|uniref:MFS transporter n=1 Tax=Rubrobacter marinus TaxID=2653852 RepID=A0A6G8Q331_9ACTN|nr:MFS transporter [Rubrobacter marinus]